ncbi:hypothetical protein PM10SUCC1_16560 [Propionigenium maris DSM 9537]|uniref:Uncharacterized protein n=1 Tax=Propionigenium maris DSM 9537 TaxID=1123000 RepID=A0A9W6GM81_9FUSO|nr:hypothetical protein [Propionigenium maris]GLI56142.1 hypothetical protein PM10SUCC1_16560 [Propionigenium maris DSM 9537]
MFKKTMIPGILGMLLIILALLCGPTQTQRWLFLLGAMGMTIMAILEHHKLFIGLQLVIVSGTLTAFLPTGEIIKGSIPILVSMPVLYILYTKGFLDTNRRYLGALSLIILGVGYAAQHPLIYFTGGFLVSLFSLLELLSGFKPALIWLTLNLIFTTLAGITLLL